MTIATECDIQCAGFSHLAEVKALLHRAGRVAMVAHTHADGDAVGSITGMYAVLKEQLQADITLMLPDGCPDDLAWLPNTHLILHGVGEYEACRKALTEADVIIGTDFSSVDRIGPLQEAMLGSKARKVVIDHHQNPCAEQFDYLFSMPDISSASELCYWVLRAMYGRDAFGVEAATSLYTGLRTDTGGMSYSNRQTSLYIAAADLIACGIDPMAINQQINNTFTPGRLMFYGFCFSQRLTVDADRHCALMVASQADMAHYGVASADTTGLINEVMRIACVECAVLVREEADGKVRLSLRSKTTTDVNRMAADLYGGGGHVHAAGATSTDTFEATIQKVKLMLGMQ